MRTALFVTALLVAPAFAQESKAPSLDAVDQGLLKSVRSVALLADKACRALPEMKAYDDTRAAVDAQLQSKYPGFALDWNVGQLRPKVAK